MPFKIARFCIAALLALSVLTLGTDAARCEGRLNSSFPFEEVCYEVVFNGTGGFSLRSYAGANAAAALATSNASSSITTYQEALELTTFLVIEYFVGSGNAKNVSLLDARTVPLVLRPPTPSHNFWASHMAVAPSRFPSVAKAPRAAGSDLSLLPMGDVTLAVLHDTLTSSPQPADFAALCKRLEVAVKAQSPGWSVDASSPYSPSHARFDSFEFYEGPFDIECWLGVQKA